MIPFFPGVPAVCCALRRNQQKSTESRFFTLQTAKGCRTIEGFMAFFIEKAIKPYKRNRLLGRKPTACPRALKIPFGELLDPVMGRHKKPPVPAALVCLFLLFSGPAFGQDQDVAGARVISPDEAVELAVKNNLTLESARVGTGTKKRAADLSWNQFIPSVTLGGSLSRDNKASTTTIPAMPPMVVENPQWHIAGSVQASLTLNAAMFESMRTLRLSYEGGLISYEKARAQLERDVRKA
jgi:hypothetical protein